MRPVVTAAEMGVADRAALEHTTIEALVGRAGAAVAAEAVAMLGGTYGRRVVVVAGKGNNGADGRVAGAILGRRGARVTVLDAAGAPHTLPRCDLVIDAAYGTGFRGSYEAPVAPGVPVLAVDIPSGVDADRGTASVGAVRADRTVTFQAEKPGLLLGEGRDRSGVVTVVDLGITLGGVAIWHVGDEDLELVPARERESHKWKSAVFVCAGSPGMLGAPTLAARAAMRSGSGMVRLAVPGGTAGRPIPPEVVESQIPATGFADAVLAELDRFGALVLGPGLGRSPGTAGAVVEILSGAALPVVLDADGIVALGSVAEAATLLTRRPGPTVLTPHDGEFERLVGRPPGPDRIGAASSLARATGSVVLLKGSTTVVAEPTGRICLVTAGSPALATGGTGDVLSGVIGAFIARGLEPADAAALGAHVHGRAAARGHRRRPGRRGPPRSGRRACSRDHPDERASGRLHAEIDLDAIGHNVGVLARLAAPALLCAVVKADAYGHGAVPVARELERIGVPLLAVALVSEGIELRDAGVSGPILLLSECPSDEVAAAVAAGLTLTVYSVDGVRGADALQRRSGEVGAGPSEGRHRDAPGRRRSGQPRRPRPPDRRLRRPRARRPLHPPRRRRRAR